MATGYYKDLSGKTFEKLTAISPYFHKFEKNGLKASIVFWDCVCECGNRYRARSQGLTSGATKSCGCFRAKPELKDKDRERRIGRSIYAANISYKNRSKFLKETDITFENWFLMSQKPCVYCGLEKSNREKDIKRGKLVTDTVFLYNGLDRVDSSIDYIQSNCVTCCKYCNWFKLDDTVDAFLQRAIDIYKRLNLEKSDFSSISMEWKNAAIPFINRSKRGFQYLSREDAFWNSAYQDNILGPNRRIWQAETDISLSMYEYIASLDCFYCGQKPLCHKTDRINGEVFNFSTLDKINPNSHYHWDNVAPSCKKCNFGKGNQSLYEFLSSIKRLVEYQQKTRTN